MMTSRPQIISLYRDNSCLSYEGDNRKGSKDIADKFEGLSFKTIQYNFENYDY